MARKGSLANPRDYHGATRENATAIVRAKVECRDEEFVDPAWNRGDWHFIDYDPKMVSPSGYDIRKWPLKRRKGGRER